jgi:hypothetical protein
MPVAHVAGIPIEETLALYGPAVLLVAGAASARLAARVRRLRRGQRHRAGERQPLSVEGARDGTAG